MHAYFEDLDHIFDQYVLASYSGVFCIVELIIQSFRFKKRRKRKFEFLFKRRHTDYEFWRTQIPLMIRSKSTLNNEVNSQSIHKTIILMVKAFSKMRIFNFYFAKIITFLLRLVLTILSCMAQE